MIVDRKCWKCELDDCGHVWIATDPDNPPGQCAKCRRRGWHSGGQQEVVQKKVPAKKKTATGKSRLQSESKKVRELISAAPAQELPKRAVEIAAAKSQKSRTCPDCKGQAFHRLFADDFWCPKCGKKVD